ncbi:MAG TPA: LysR family transcriptional regulator [Gemmatimonadales bacterium]|nr:LysR family transcriptional regulator [Gemmatimonadales bacterium]
MRYFVAVAEELHFGRAALRLHVAQPALSQQIQQLERELGVLLLARTKRRVALTDAGSVFLAEARRTLAAADAAVRVARRAAAGETGRLRIGYVDLATWLSFPAILRAYRERFPAVEVTLTELHREPQREALLSGELDVGFFSLKENEAGLTGARVASDPLVAALPAGHRLAAKARVTLRELAEEPWVLFPRELKTNYVELVLGCCRAAGFVPRIVQEASQLHTLAGLVSAGVGVSLLPASVAAAERVGVSCRPLAGAIPRLSMEVIWPEGDLSPAATRFVAIAREISADPLRPRNGSSPPRVSRR